MTGRPTFPAFPARLDDDWPANDLPSGLVEALDERYTNVHCCRPYEPDVLYEVEDIVGHDEQACG
jgi:hypothetical protein